MSAEERVTAAMRSKKRGVVVSEAVDLDMHFEKKNFPKNAASRRAIGEALAKHFLFSALETSDKEDVINAMEQRTLEDGEIIIHEGDSGDDFYVVEKGKFDIFVDNNKVGSVGPGGSFGELALLYNCPRAATVKSTQSSVLWVLDRITFRHTLARTTAGERHETLGYLRNVSLLQTVTDAQLTQLADAVQIVHFQRGERVITKGENGNIFYMLKEGVVTVTDTGARSNDIDLNTGDYFGERALLMNEPRAATVVSKTDTVLMALDRETFVEVLGPLRDLLDHNFSLAVLRSVPILSNLNEGERVRLVDGLSVHAFEDNEFIITQGEPGEDFYIIKQGTCKVTQTKSLGRETEITRLSAGEYFGEMALLSDESRNANVVAVGPVECFRLHRDMFTELLGPLQDIMERDAIQRKRQLAEASKPKVKISDLREVSTLGTGTFGRVKLMQHKQTGEPYAMKVLQKAQVIAYKQQKNVMNEKNVMVEADHPFILKLVTTFKDRYCLYMLLELVLGGELFTYLHGGDIEYLSSGHARFYTACVLQAFMYIHEKHIAYRDLKPENLMIDAEGYIKVVDFGFAKVVQGRTYTLCGTPEYLSPELVLGKGHNQGVDYWALGVLIYEMVVGYSPFADHVNANQVVICRNIVNNQVKWPGRVDEPALRDIVEKLLTKQPAQRLGMGKRGAQDIADHPWFDGLDWLRLLRKELPAPWLPPISDPLDTSNFDPYIEPEVIDKRVTDHSDWDHDF